jgi:ABC-type branched-subunit amino acid transport system substrate-binding protein
VAADDDVIDVREAVLGHLRDLGGYQGITKKYSFSETGQVEIGPEGVWIYEWSNKDGDFIAVGPASELIRQ